MLYKIVSYIFSVVLIEVKYQVFSYLGMLKVQINCSDFEISSRFVTTNTIAMAFILKEITNYQNN